MTESISSDLAFYLKRLRLPRVAEQLPTISQLAVQEDWSYEAFLASLLEAEVFARDQAALERRIRTARFPSRNKTLENFDFTFQTSVRRQVMLQLASLRFIELAQNVIFLGPPGTGKPQPMQYPYRDDVCTRSDYHRCRPSSPVVWADPATGWHHTEAIPRSVLCGLDPTYRGTTRSRVSD